MVQKPSQEQISELDSSLSRVGVSLSRILEDSREVVLFGSRAIGTAKSDSDWDLLLIDPATKPKAPGIDVVAVQTDPKGWRTWLRSELAHHVADYGLWLKGNGSWCSQLEDLSHAADHKLRRLRVRLRSVLRLWLRLDERSREKWVTLIRRDFQRLMKLRKEVSSPPSSVLDAEFATSPALIEDVLSELSVAGESDLVQTARSLVSLVGAWR